MIIEAGYDIFELRAAKLLRWRRPRNRVGVCAMDENLRYLRTAEIHYFSGDCCPACIRFTERILANHAHAESMADRHREIKS